MTAKAAIQRIDRTTSGDTRTRLLDAALLEFNEGGYSGTDTNRIARRAGFAPQTFYRWFKDKTEIFIVVYQVWEDTERTVLQNLLARRASTKQLVEAIVDHHRDYKVFRRSLRHLSLDDPAIRSARAASRKRQLDQIEHWHREFHDGSLSRAALATILLQMERLADALAEDELTDMDISPAAGQRALAALIESVRGK